MPTSPRLASFSLAGSRSSFPPGCTRRVTLGRKLARTPASASTPAFCSHTCSSALSATPFRSLSTMQASRSTRRASSLASRSASRLHSGLLAASALWYSLRATCPPPRRSTPLPWTARSASARSSTRPSPMARPTTGLLARSTPSTSSSSSPRSLPSFSFSASSAMPMLVVLSWASRTRPTGSAPFRASAWPLSLSSSFSLSSA
mmetsp:Transcript_11536/g.32696  ORF Transcript_11536/g.32696 Transcript_11536/m.32696 type:complete len:204 (-) Transcript_11536:228-839(-)